MPTDDNARFVGWPITITQDATDGRKPHAQLTLVKLDGVPRPGVQVYTVRAQTEDFTPRFYAAGEYTIKAGKAKPVTILLRRVETT